MIGLLMGLRGFALVLIVASQLAAADILPPEFGSGLDQIGLMIVVITTGFVQALTHVHEPFSAPNVQHYAASRARRLLPGYYVALVASLAVSGWWQDWPFRFDSVGQFLRAVVLVDAPGVLWIVPALAQCALLFVLAWWLWSRGWSPWWIVAIPVVVVGLCVAVGWLPASGHGLGAVAPYFFGGFGLGLMWSNRLEPWLVRNLGLVSVVGGLAFVLVCINLPAVRANHGLTFGESILASTWFDPVNALLVFALVVATATRPIALAVLGTVPLLVLGRFWYAGYLLVPVLVAALP